jgi:hypothetical protein
VNRCERLRFDGSMVVAAMVKSGLVLGQIVISKIRFDRGSKLSETKMSARLGITDGERCLAAFGLASRNTRL